MIALIDKSEIKGRIDAPPSKSYTIRGLMCSSLAKGESKLISPLRSDDTEAAASVLMEAGVKIFDEGDLWRVVGGELCAPEKELFCRESAATLRFMTAVCSAIPGEFRLTSGPTLAGRPIKPLIEALRRLGAEISSNGKIITGGGLRGGAVELPGDVSSQFISALLLAAPLAREGVRIRLTTPLKSKPYVLMTLKCLEEFGIKVRKSDALDEFEVGRGKYRPTRFKVEGDWSSASYLLALGAVGGEVEVGNLNLESLQGDKTILNFLKEMGAEVEIKQDSVAVKRSELRAIRADLSDCIDLFPAMVALAASAKGTSELLGIERARLKESNRVSAMKEGLERMGIRAREEKDRFLITGSFPKGAVIDSKNDHRIAMAFSILGILAGKTLIKGAECVRKTFPHFWEALKGIGGEVKLNGE